METFFAYIDDSGNYQRDRSVDFTKRNPYHVKACILIPARNWKKLCAYQAHLLHKYTGQRLAELKWNHLWKLQRRDVKHKPISFAPGEAHLTWIRHPDAQAYATDFLSVLPECEARVACTVTPNVVFRDRVSERELERMHLQDLMQRVEMEVSSQDPAGLAVVFADQMSGNEEQRDLRQLYSELRSGADEFLNYDHVMDSVCFVESAHCCGIQLADFVAGAVNGFLRGFGAAEKLFALRIYAHVRSAAAGGKLGYGMIEVPKRRRCRQHLEEKFKTDFERENIAFGDDIPF